MKTTTDAIVSTAPFSLSAIRRRLPAPALALAAALALLLPALPAAAEDKADTSPVIYTTFNTAGVRNGPRRYPEYRNDEGDVLLTSVTTYHWNDSRGAVPGSISIYDKSTGECLGMWPASTRHGNTWWDSFPRIVLEKGKTYYFVDSGQASWSYNNGSGDAGFIELCGVPTPDPAPAPTVASPVQAPAPAAAFEKYMMRIPATLHPQDGSAGVYIPAAEPTAVALPLRDGTFAVVWNQAPNPCTTADQPRGSHVAKNVSDRNIVTLLRESADRCPSVFVDIGGSTFFAVLCGGCKAYEGVLVAKGAAFPLSVYLPEGRGFDDEVRGILRQVEFTPPSGYGVDAALSLYGPDSRLAAAVRYPALLQLVEARPEVWELVAALRAASEGHPGTIAWCDGQLRRLNPAVYDPSARNADSVRPFDPKSPDEMDAAMMMTSAHEKAVPTSARVPDGEESAPVADAQHAPQAEPAAVPKAPPPSEAGATKTVTLPGGATMEMVWCPPGTYMMGCTADEPGWRSKDGDRPIKVTLTKGFWLGKCEVTQRQYKSVMGKGPADPRIAGDDLPADGVSWFQADEFCRKVGNGARLPTEAEWEYACRAGSETAFHWGDSCNGTQANCDGTYPCGTEEKGPFADNPVKGGSYPPNRWGLYDMAGNELEWCSDWYDRFGDDVTELTDPKGSEFETTKVMRGGSFDSSCWQCRSACRLSDEPDRTYWGLGFRMVMDE